MNSYGAAEAILDEVLEVVTQVLGHTPHERLLQALQLRPLLPHLGQGSGA